MDSNPNDEASSASQAQPQGPQVTNLKHALALVKGELGTRDADATYNTVHGGPQGLWTGLKSLEARHNKQGETLRCCQDNVDLLTTESKAAWGKNNEAMRAVEQLANFEGQSKVSLLESQLATMLAKVTEMEATLKKASTFVMDLSAYVLSLSSQQSTGRRVASRWRSFLLSSSLIPSHWLSSARISRVEPLRLEVSRLMERTPVWLLPGLI